MLPFSKRGARPRTELNDTTCTAPRPQRRAATRQPLSSRFLLCTLHARKPHREQPNAGKARFQARQKHRLGQGQRRNGRGATGSPPNTRQAKRKRRAQTRKPKGKDDAKTRMHQQKHGRTQTHGHKLKQKRDSCKQKHKPRGDQMLSHVYGYVFSGAKH